MATCECPAVPGQRLLAPYAAARFIVCGINGIVSGRQGFTEQQLRAELLAMNSLIAHRGPDDDQVWIGESGQVGLGHRRLSIIDISEAGRQPMDSHDGRWTVAYNGELYNTDDLRRRLARPARDYRGHSDTEVLVEAIAAWGVIGTAEAINGMFAFAAWDHKQRELWLARDRFGEKPLYYAATPERLVFSSELRPIRRFPGFDDSISRLALADLLAHYSVGGSRTIYENVCKVAPGHVLKFTPGSGDVDDHTYWSPATVACEQRPRSADARTSVDELEAMLAAVVSSRLVSDVPLGAFLSGGIDSSVVVAMMRRVGPTPKTFSIGFPEADYDESGHARRVAEHLDTDHHELMVSGSDALAVVPRLARIYDEPFADSSQIPTFIVSRFAAEHVTVSLSGDGGDELFGGYERYRYLERLQQLSRFPPILRHALSTTLGRMPAARVDRFGGTRMAGRLPAAFRNRPGHRLDRLGRLLAAGDAWSAYDTLVAVDIDPAAVVLGAASVTNHAPDGIDDFDATRIGMLHDTMHYLPNDILTKVDRAAMSVSLETRVPLLDPGLFEFAWGLSPTLRVREGQGKWILKEVLARHVPRSLIDRPKQGFGVPMGKWLRGPLRPWADDLLDEQLVRSDGFFDAAEVGRRWRTHLGGTTDLQAQLWPILMFQSWRHDGPT